MNRNAIKIFAIWARRYLREQVTTRLAFFGINSKNLADFESVSGGILVAGNVLSGEEGKQYQGLRDYIDSLRQKSLKERVELVIDEIAYTWFNRLVALRYMEVNGYIGRVLSSSNPQLVDPDILREAGEVAELGGIEGLDYNKLSQWRTEAANYPNTDEYVYRRLLFCQCEALGGSLPFLFAGKSYLSLFLPANLLNQDSIIRKLVTDIPESDWLSSNTVGENGITPISSPNTSNISPNNNIPVGANGIPPNDTPDDSQDVEIIGWLYQFYISERKDEVIGAKSQVISADIPAATQLFTPHWIVRYMVENSLGRLWHEQLTINNEQLTINNYQLPINNYQLPMNNYQLPINNYQLPVNNEQLSGDNEQLSLFTESVTSSLPQSLVSSPLRPQDLTVCDPACGSGHILVYAFSLLVEIYREQGYSEREIPELILTNNLYGLDIDERAVQLTCFALFMKARAIDKRFFRRGVRLNVTTVKSSHRGMLPRFAELVADDWFPLLDCFVDADNLGSLITPSSLNLQNEGKEEDGRYYEDLWQQLAKCRGVYPAFESQLQGLEGILLQSELLRKKYAVVVANPPYMGNKSLNPILKEFAKKHYPDAKSDVFAMFIERINQWTHEDSYIGLITPFVWMFISSYEKFREKILDNFTITSLIQLEYNAFEPACIPVCTFTLKKPANKNQLGTYIKLSDFKGHQNQSPKTLEAINNPDCGYLFYAKSADFKKIPGNAIAYWVSERFINTFSSKKLLGQIYPVKIGMRTGDNNRFLRKWFEINNQDFKIDSKDKNEAEISSKKWFPYNKGGEFRKWYGNNEFVVLWYRDGLEIKANTKKVYPQLGDNLGWKISNEEYYFLPSITWSFVSSSHFGVRYSDKGFLFDVGGSCAFANERYIYSLISFLCSKVAFEFMKAINPTLNFQIVNVASLPIDEILNQDTPNNIAEKCIDLSRQDWDNFETSWNFKRHPLTINNYQLSIINEEVNISSDFSVEKAFKQWETETEKAFQTLKQLEEENNRYWIEAYNLQDELTPEVPDEQITIRRADLSRDIRSLISYFIGCLMGRYSLDKLGLNYAGDIPPNPVLEEGNMNIEIPPSPPLKGGNMNMNMNIKDLGELFTMDKDGIIPITDKAYFEDDIVNQFIAFLKVVYSPETLTENLKYIANALNPKTSELPLQTIRRYFITEFITDHIKTYKKRPIYWLFSSGKKRAFGALVYLHRYDDTTIGRIRTDYVLPLQLKLNSEIERMQKDIDIITSTNAKKQAQKQLKLLQEQQSELREYQAKLQTFADSRINLDLDDGVAYNYTRFKGIIYEGSELKMSDLEKAAQWKINPS